MLSKFRGDPGFGDVGFVVGLYLDKTDRGFSERFPLDGVSDEGAVLKMSAAVVFDGEDWHSVSVDHEEIEEFCVDGFVGTVAVFFRVGVKGGLEDLPEAGLRENAVVWRYAGDDALEVVEDVQF